MILVSFYVKKCATDSNVLAIFRYHVILLWKNTCFLAWGFCVLHPFHIFTTSAPNYQINVYIYIYMQTLFVQTLVHTDHSATMSIPLSTNKCLWSMRSAWFKSYSHYPNRQMMKGPAKFSYKTSFRKFWQSSCVLTSPVGAAHHSKPVSDKNKITSNLKIY